MRILWLATKAPWPPRDGGRLVAALTLEALAAAGIEPTVVAPVVGARAAAEAGAAARQAGVELVTVSARPLPLPLAAVVGLLRRVPLTIARHDTPRMRRRVADVALARRPQVLHVEQLQALGGAAHTPRLPCVLRSQNVESDLWTATADSSPWGPLLRREAARLAAFEARALSRVSVVAALTREDTSRLAELSGRQVDHLPAPFPAVLPSGPPLPGAPAVVLLAGGWRPNREGAEWFLRGVWPRVLSELPEARLHIFGGPVFGGRVFGGEAAASASGIVYHGAPGESGMALATGALLAVPLRVASGVRMKILEAWARGLPTVATSAAARGLGAVDGRELRIADSPEAMAAAIVGLATDPASGSRLVAAGRQLLVEHHRPEAIVRGLIGLYDRALGASRGSG